MKHIKRTLITGYCWGVVPAWLVTLGFRIFELKSA